ncbi:MAG: RNA polymerase sigma factor [Planctomycetaceae bacterium]
MNEGTAVADDDRLMLRIQSGDPTAFEELVERHEGPLLGFFRRNTRDLQFSEDLAQETLLRIYNQAWDYLPRGRFASWMYRIARNLLIDNIRRQSHDALVKAVRANPQRESDALARLAGEVLSPVERARHRELAALVDEHLEQLPEEQRLTFILHHYAGLTLSEVAEVMESSLPTTKSRLRLAREKLQDQLRRHGVTDPHDPQE